MPIDFIKPLLIVAFYAIFAILAWRRLPWAVLLVIATLPSYLIRFHLGPIPMTLLEGMILIVFAVWLIQSVQRSAFSVQSLTQSLRSMLYAIRWPLALFLIASTAAIFVAPDLRAAAGIWKAYFIEPVLFFLILLDLLIHHPNLLQRRQIIGALSVSALLLSLYAIFQRFTGFGIPPPWDKELRVTSIFLYPNALGLFLGPLVPLFVARAFTARGLLVISYWLLVTIASVLAIVFAKSTGALVGIAAGLFIMSLIWTVRRFSHDREKNAAKTFYILHFTFYILVIAGIVAALLTIPRIKDELLLRNWSGHVRRTQWTETVTMLQDRPLLGAGLAGYKETLTPYHKATYLEIFEYPHNIVLNFWSETGLLGLLTFVWLIIIFFRYTLQSLKIRNSKLVIPAMASMVVMLVHGLVDVPYFKNDLSALFWIIFALGLTNAPKNEKMQS